MTLNLKGPELRELKPRIMVCGVGGGGCNAVNNMIASGLSGVDFIVANTDAQALTASRAERIIQMGLQVTEGLGAGAQPEIGRAAAEEAIEEIRDHLAGSHMCFVTAGMGGGTGTGAAPVIARAARDLGILTVGVVTKPFQFEGMRRMRTADLGISELQKAVDTLIVIPNQNLFRIATERTTFADAFAMADQVLYSGVASITDLMVKQGLVNLDFADVRSIMRDMGKAMMGTGEASGEKRAMHAAEAAIANPLLDEVSMKGARGLLISITGGRDMTLYELDEAASRIRQEVDEEANIILGATFDESLEGVIRVSVVATGLDKTDMSQHGDYEDAERRIAEAAERLRAQTAMRHESARVIAQAAAAPQVQEVHHYAPQVQQHAPQAYEAPVEEQPAPVAIASAPQPQHYQPAPAPQMRAPQPAPAIEDVQIAVAPQPAPSYYEPAPAPAPQPQAMAPAPQFAPIPPQAPRARMPQIEDMPPHIQQQWIEDRSQQRTPASNPVEQRRRTLLERLTSFATSREDAARAAAPQQRPIVAPVAPQRPVAPAPQQHVSEYAKRAPAAPRPTYEPRAQQRPQEEDQLEIPAFLRRQAN
ncbi:MAG: cell division protein FtsZ [Hyphomicrobiales bacterium]|nr:cell division protein FtsZ [Hyphomicrobiales bacterium]